MAALDSVRDRIRRLDEEIVEAIAQRIEAAREAGRVKREHHRAIRDYDVERSVVGRIRGSFEDRGLDPTLGEELARMLIAEALRVQERDGLEPATGQQGSVLVVGGAGKMGRWLSHFMNGLGYEVVVHDVAGPVEGFPSADDPLEQASQSDVVALATPPTVTADLLEEFAPSGALVFDIASLKTPLIEPLQRLSQDHLVTSVHPLWGPSTRVLSGKNVAVMDCGNREAVERARDIFTQTAATVVTLPLHLHDRLMAYTLDLPHALNLLYAEVLSTSGQAFSELRLLGGPTFLQQNRVAAEVANEDPELYRQIQALNDETPRIYQALHDAIDVLASRIHDPPGFRDRMLEYRTYLEPGEEGSQL